MKVGLTGGIACGKSLVAEYLYSEHSVPIIDADTIAHRLTEKGEPALDQIVEIFGREVLCEDGALNHDTMRSIVFSDARKKALLESILHPVIRQQMLDEAQSLQDPYVVLVIPLLIEINMQDSVDCVVVVDCPLQMQIQRIAQRNQFSEEEARKIIASQCAREKRLAVADIIVDNDKSTESLRKNVASLHQDLLSKCHGQYLTG